jgi:hypothetical protein
MVVIPGNNSGDMVARQKKDLGKGESGILEGFGCGGRDLEQGGHLPIELWFQGEI